MAVSLVKVMLRLLDIPEESRLCEKILHSAGLLVAVSEAGDGVLEPVELAELWSPLLERRKVAERQVAALWIAAKFWGSSLQRTSLSTLVADLLCHHNSLNASSRDLDVVRDADQNGTDRDLGEVASAKSCCGGSSESLDLCGAGWRGTLETIDRLCKTEVELLRRHNFVVPGACLGMA
ncbi:hypothetical protein ERJ75_000823000 [Trypanosoma vivax]|uniref:Uncharacterized protein n=1 Tax=Trypanosoma vivax (strain Y486) TaxID=1055687 RepID=G0UBH4_TRYVY|nr:hypothetical protein TRVL_09198 [Trypanosoma vivax]KAH8612971.1 hypothetical protein ERJ75_000823000 [Trypanosoma vivax]CCC53170.1 conserved hypothetical protein [Trypanosoma vivax Y486]